MRLDLDPEHFRNCMRLWRESVDLEIPMKDEFKLHMMEQRPAILRRFEQASSAWLMALHYAIPDAGSKDDFDALVVEIGTFNTWAKAEMKKLSDMALTESVQSGLEAAMQNPAIVEALRKIARKLKPDGDAPP